jgi:hypothetical protein
MVITACVRFAAPVFARMEATWLLTVRIEMQSSRAISLSVRPPARSERISPPSR